MWEGDRAKTGQFIQWRLWSCLEKAYLVPLALLFETWLWTRWAVDIQQLLELIVRYEVRDLSL